MRRLPPGLGLLVAGAFLALGGGAPAAPQDGAAPKSSVGICNHAMGLINKGKFTEAIDYLKANREHVDEEDLPLWWGNIGIALKRLHNYSEAMRHFDEAIKLRPGCWFHQQRALVHHLFGRWDEARADLDADEDIRAEEKKSGRPAYLRMVVDGPFREVWPHAYRKLELRSPAGHYHVVSNAGLADGFMTDLEKKCVALDPKDPAQARKLEALLKPTPELQNVAALTEIMRSEYMKMVKMKDEDWPAGRIFKVYYFANQGDFAAFDARLGSPPSEGTLGYYQPGLDFLSLFSTPGGKLVYGFTEETMDTFFHEAFHQFFHVLCDDPPIWMNEGIAEVVGKSAIQGGGKRVDMGLLVKKRGEQYMTRYQVVQEHLQKGSAFPFRKLFRTTSDEWHAGDKGLYYAQSWAVCYYAFRGKNPQFTEDFLALFWGIVKGRPLEDLLKERFPDEKLDAYEKQWREFMRKL